METQNKDKLILAYNKLKEELNTQRDSETLKKYEILNKAYKLGKKIYGNTYSISKLSLDFELPFTTTKRILSLTKANNKTWELIKSGKMSAFKAAMILCSKHLTYQDEVMQMVIKNNLSTYDIKNIKIKNYDDVKREKLRIAVERGFSREDSAFHAFINTINRLNELLNLNEDFLTKNKRDTIRKELSKLNKRIETYIEIEE